MENTARTTPDKLIFQWLPAADARQLAHAHHFQMQQLFHGMNTISYAQYEERLASGQLEIAICSNGAAFLVSWGESNRKKMCQIMTLIGIFDDTADAILEAFEDAVYQRGGRVILSFGRKGYAPITRRHGYTIDECILMRKELRDDTRTKN